MLLKQIPVYNFNTILNGKEVENEVVDNDYDSEGTSSDNKEDAFEIEGTCFRNDCSPDYSCNIEDYFEDLEELDEVEGFDFSQDVVSDSSTQLGRSDNVTSDDERVETLEEVLVDIQKVFSNSEPTFEALKERKFLQFERKKKRNCKLKEAVEILRCQLKDTNTKRDSMDQGNIRHLVYLARKIDLSLRCLSSKESNKEKKN